MPILPGIVTSSVSPALAVPNVTRVDVLTWRCDPQTSQGTIVLAFNSTPGNGRTTGPITIEVNNGSCYGVMKNPTPNGFDDDITVKSMAIATGFDQMDAAENAVSGRVNRAKAVFNWALSVGLIDAGLGVSAIA
jgi:hypothetical protein